MALVGGKIQIRTIYHLRSKYGVMKCPEKISPLIKGSIATPSLVAGIMNSLPFPSAWL